MNGIEEWRNYQANRVSARDVTAAILVSQNNKIAATLV